MGNLQTPHCPLCHFLLEFAFAGLSAAASSRGFASYNNKLILAWPRACRLGPATAFGDRLITSLNCTLSYGDQGWSNFLKRVYAGT